MTNVILSIVLVFDMAPHLGTFLVLIKVSEKAKKMCLPWPRRWAGPCYRVNTFDFCIALNG